MTAGQALVLVTAMALFFAIPAALGVMPWSAALFALGIMGSGVALALALRRWLDRSVANSLSQGGPPGSDSAAFEVSSYTPFRSWNVIGTVTTTAAGVGERFSLHNAKQRRTLRLLKRLGFGRRLDVDDDEFNREVYVERNPEIGDKLFAAAERREAARAIFRMGFFAIEYRHGLVVALRHGKVPDDVAVRVCPHLLLLAKE